MIALFLSGSNTYAQSTYYSHLPEGKVNFQIETSKILVKFHPATTIKERKRIIASEPLLSFQAPNSKRYAAPATFISLKNPKTSPKQVEGILTRLNQFDEIIYANPFLVTNDGRTAGLQDQILISIKSLADKDYLMETLEVLELELVEQKKLRPNLFLIRTTKATGKNAIEIATFLHETNQFQYAEPDFMSTITHMQNDPLLQNQWPIDNTGMNFNSFNGTPDADMDVSDAWGCTTGHSGIKIAILDDGVDLDHPDLIDNLEPGFDATNNPEPLANPGDQGGWLGADRHGTSCAGVAAAVGNNSLGVTGVAYDASIIPVRIFYKDVDAPAATPSGSVQLISTNSWSGSGIDWAVAQGADVISCSWGVNMSSFVINQAISDAVTLGRGGLGTLVFFATGNDDGPVNYPANNNQTIAVMATSPCDERKSPTSCDGETWWGSSHGTNGDISAPGVQVITTDVQGFGTIGSSGNYRFFNGTSSACPNAAGVMALILSVNPTLTHQEAREAIEITCDKVGGYSYTTGVAGQPNGSWSNDLGYGRVNAHQAVELVKAPSVAIDAGILTTSLSTELNCTNILPLEVLLHNYGSAPLTSVTIICEIDGAIVQTFPWTGSLASLNSTTINLIPITVSSGSHTLEVYTTNPNGTTDENPANDSEIDNFIVSPHTLSLSLTLDNFGSETTWRITDATGNLLASGGPYPNGIDQTIITENICLPDGCHDFTIFDSQNNGMCCSDGLGGYHLVNELTGMPLATGGLFTNLETTSFCLDDPPQTGDVGISGIPNLDDECDFDDPVPITVTIENLGATSISNIPVSYSINGGIPVTETAAGPILSGEDMDYTFTIPADLSADGFYTIMSWTSLMGDANTSNDWLPIVIENLPNPEVTVTVTPLTCGGSGMDGEALATPVDGTPPYTYQWFSDLAVTGNHITGLSLGSHLVKVVDANGCSGVTQFSVNEGAITLEVTTEDVSCNGNTDGAAEVTNLAGGVAPYSYEWNTSPIQTSAIASNLEPGSYTVTVTDDNGCVAMQSVTIAEPDPLMVEIEAEDVSCNGAEDGSAVANPEGGTTPYTYHWDTSPPQTTQEITDLPPGSYTVTVTDANGCTATETTTITEPAPISVTASITDESSGGDGEIDLSISGGSGSFIVTWTCPTCAPQPCIPCATCPPCLTGSFLEDLHAGSYTVFISDANSPLCYFTQTFIVNPAPQVCPYTVSCFPHVENFEDEDNLSWLQHNGESFDWTIHSGSTPTPGTGPAAAFQGDQYAYIEASDQDPLDVAAFLSPCYDLTGKTSAELTLWYHMHGAGLGALQIGASTDGGTTWIQLTDISGPQGDEWVEVTTDLSYYVGQVVWLRIAGRVGGPTLDVSIDSIKVSASNQFEGDLSINLLSPTSNCGLTSNETVTVEVTNHNLIPVNQFHISYTVNGQAFTTQQIFDEIPGWTTNQYTFDAADGLGADLSVPGIYTLEAFVSAYCDGTNTNNSDILVVEHGSPPMLVMSSEPVSCHGDNDGTAHVSVPGSGSGSLSYSWNTSPAQTTASATGLPPGNYIVTVTNTITGCLSTGSATILEPDPLDLVATLTPSNTGANNGIINLTATGGTPPYQYSIDGVSFQSNNSFTNLAPGTYTVTVEDEKDCIQTITVTIIEEEVDCATTLSTFPYSEGFESSFGLWNQPTDDDTDWLLNFGSTVTWFTGPSSAIEGIQYAYIEASGASNQTAILESPCIDVSTMANPLLQFNYHLYGSNMGTLYIELSADGGNTWSPPVWEEGGNQGDEWFQDEISLAGYGNVIMVRFVGTTGSGAKSDMAIDGLRIFDWPIDVGVNSITKPQSSCWLTNAEVITVEIENFGTNDATDFPISYSIDGGAPQTEIVPLLPALSTLTYTFSIPADFSMEATYILEVWTAAMGDVNPSNDLTADDVTHFESLNVSVAPGDVTHVTCPGGMDGSATVTVTGGQAPYSYQWGFGSPPTSNPTATNLSAGTHFVIVRDVNNCIGFTNVMITEPDPIEANATIEEPDPGMSNGSIIVSPAGGTGPYSLLWSPGGFTTPTLSGLAAGTYTLAIMDALGCTETFTFELEELLECTSILNTFPYSEGFEANNLGAWEQSDDDDWMWIVNSGSTLSNNTGPDAAASGTYYAYVEASDHFVETAILESPCFDISSLTNPSFGFAYHMFGQHMGRLEVQVSTDEGNTWSSSIWGASGNLGEDWLDAAIPLSSYSGSSPIKLRLIARTGPNFQSDIAIDQLTLGENSGGGGGGGGGVGGYCTQGAQSSQDDWIANVRVGAINNPSGDNGGYGDFTHISIPLTLGDTVPIGVTPGHMGGQSYPEGWSVWIDYNRDSDFDDPGERIWTANPSTSLVLGSFTVPTNAQTGSTRLRVLMERGNIPTSGCAQIQYGEAEDYTVVLSAGGSSSDNSNESLLANSSEEETENLSALFLYPNPTQKGLNLVFSLNESSNCTFKVFDLNGKIVQEESVSLEVGEQTQYLNLEKLSEGSYLLRLETHDTRISKPFVIMRN